jgi:hypothetical protein
LQQYKIIGKIINDTSTSFFIHGDKEEIVLMTTLKITLHKKKLFCLCLQAVMIYENEGLALSSLDHLYLGVENNMICRILYGNALLIVLLNPFSRHDDWLEDMFTWHIIP